MWSRTAALAAAAATIALAATIAACDGALANDDSVSGGAAEPGVSLDLCGVVKGWTAPTDKIDGSLAIDNRSWPVASGTDVTGKELLTVGANVCAKAQLDVNRRIVSCTVAAPPPDPWAAAGY